MCCCAMGCCCTAAAALLRCLTPAYVCLPLCPVQACLSIHQYLAALGEAPLRQYLGDRDGV